MIKVNDLENDDGDSSDKVPLSAKVTCEVKDCFGILMTGLQPRITADNVIKLLLSGDPASSNRISEYLEVNITNIFKEKLEMDIKNIKESSKSLVDFGTRVRELKCNLEDRVNRFILKNKLFPLGGLGTYRFILDNILRDRLVSPTQILDKRIQIESEKYSSLESLTIFSGLEKFHKDYETLRYFKESEIISKRVTSYFYDSKDDKELRSSTTLVMLQSSFKELMLGLGRLLNVDSNDKDFEKKVLSSWFMRTLDISEFDMSFI